MKTAIIQGAMIGAKAGFLSAAIYAILFLMGAELFLPIPDPSEITVFTLSNLKFVGPIFLVSSIFWLLLPTILGALTGSSFGFFYTKFKLPYKIYISICTALCATFSFFVSTMALISLIATSYTKNFFLDIFWNSHLQISFLLTTGLLFVPSAIFILIGFIVSRSLYRILVNLENAQTPIP